MPQVLANDGHQQSTSVRPPPSGQNSQTIVALRSLQFRYLPQYVVRDRDLTSLAVVLLSMVVDNDYHRNCDDLRTTRDGLTRHGNVKEMRVTVSNEIWTESQRIVLSSANFQHAENLPTNATDNFGRLRSTGFVSDNWRQHTMIGGKFKIAIRSLKFLVVTPYLS